jgi:bifunctional N-acetylglucosamine-1-phosphate-uridyltransferase/glucosamine-1-phosphate-acetyltransferase GlmU-like protein
VVHILADADQRVETVHTENIEEALGINDRADLELAERIKDIASVESVSELGGCVHRAREPTANVLVESQRSHLPESLCDHDNRFREDLSG